MKKRFILLLILSIVLEGTEAQVFPFNNKDIPVNERIDDLLGRLSTDEKISQLLYNSPAIGLTFWTPNINIFRDPRWGRGQETYGEDPFLTGRMGSAFVKGLQGNDPNYLKAAACAKHFAVHSGPEKTRHEVNVFPSEKDFRETYLPAFKSLVDADVEAVMCAYNRLYDEPC